MAITRSLLQFGGEGLGCGQSLVVPHKFLPSLNVPLGEALDKEPTLYYVALRTDARCSSDAWNGYITMRLEMADKTEFAPEMGAIQVFQILHIKAAPRNQLAVRRRLVDAASPPWIYSGDDDPNDDPNIVVFHHSGDTENCRVRLALRQNDDGFKVVNINPHEPGGISMGRYNYLLQDFAKHVAVPAINGQNASLEVTRCMQNPVDWFGDDAAWSLYVFSRNANKTNGYHHPYDWDRWNDFLIKVHESGRSAPATECLERWLHESEGWSEEMSQQLSLDYEASCGLLDAYDKHKQEGSNHVEAAF